MQCKKSSFLQIHMQINSNASICFEIWRPCSSFGICESQLSNSHLLQIKYASPRIVITFEIEIELKVFVQCNISGYRNWPYQSMGGKLFWNSFFFSVLIARWFCQENATIFAIISDAVLQPIRVYWNVDGRNFTQIAQFYDRFAYDDDEKTIKLWQKCNFPIECLSFYFTHFRLLNDSIFWSFALLLEIVPLKAFKAEMTCS